MTTPDQAFSDIPEGDHRLLDDEEIREAYKVQQQELAALRAQLDQAMRVQEQLAENVNTGLLENRTLRARVADLEQQLARDHRDWAERYADTVEKPKEPWSFAPVVHEDNLVVGLFGAEHYGRVATLIDGPNSREQTIATAAHIVRCVNSHDQLVEAATAVMAIWDTMVQQETAHPPYVKKFEQLKAALALAQEVS